MLLLLLLLLAMLWWREGAEGHREPWKYYQTYQLQVQRTVEVPEGLCVRVPCSFSYPKDGWTESTPAHGYWFWEGAKTNQDAPVATDDPDRKVQEETQGRFHLLGSPHTYNCSLDIRDARRTDNRTYFYRVERGKAKWNYQEDYLSVHVIALTHLPDIIIPETLHSGHPTNLTCSVPWACEQGTPPIFSWMTSAVTTLGPRTRRSSALTLTPRPQDHGTSLACQVNLPGAGVTRTRTVLLDVSSPGDKGPCLPSPQHRCVSFSPRPSAELDRNHLPWKQHSTHNPGEWLISFSPGGPVPAPGLCCRQQPPCQAELGPWEPDTEPLTVLEPRGPGAAPGGVKSRRQIHLPSSAPSGLPAHLPEPLCAEKSVSFIRSGTGGHQWSRCYSPALPVLLHHRHHSEAPQEEGNKASSRRGGHGHGGYHRCHQLSLSGFCD
ncbi:myeloid cell surface antigen CD33-like isoform X2 [Equus przewalskii]|uniref:Myeloid cell surface antigen CD33-like isoform X2 n=1 Tax=Equus przewalskii TaxID=9798 RepID=A0ABM4JEP7_EQUPR